MIDTIEFIGVTQLRGGAEARIKAGRSRGKLSYAEWNTISAKAGKNLLKISKPSKAPLPTFDDSDLDL